MKRKILTLFMCTALVLSMAACGSGNGSPQEAGAKNTASAPDFNFEDIEWEVTESIEYGERRPVFNYTNNSKYDITEIDFNMKLKDDVTESDVNKSEELKKKAKDMDEEPTDLTIQVVSNNYVSSGESAENLDICLDGTIQLFTDYEAYELFEPDTITIYFVDDGCLYKTAYDYLNSESTGSSYVQEAFEWSDSEIASLLPKPNNQVVTVSYDDDSFFSASLLGSSMETYKSYVQQCKSKGFTKDEGGYDPYWTASNKDGYEVQITFYEEEESISVQISKID